MLAVREIVESIADTDAAVLIRGESGVGKDIVARAIHAASVRGDRPFVKVNCAALPAGLLESELFGHEKGAFTGAYRRSLGQFEYAHNATIFLDEIGEIPLALQAKLLHVLQDFQFCRVGGREMIRVDARIIASTNRDLEHALTRGDFREDLYYRLNVVEVVVPPLRERQEEIAALAEWFLAKFNAQYRRNKELAPEILALLEEHPWSGNVRELENVMRRLVVLSNDEHVCEALRNGSRDSRHRRPLAHAPGTNGYPTEGLREIARRGAREAERQALAEVLEHVQWNKAEAARVLKVSYKTLLNKITECRLAPQSPGSAV
jgi:two-component system response regulator AtoC